MKPEILLSGAMATLALAFGVSLILGAPGANGSHKKITMYAASGAPIGEWTTKENFRPEPGLCHFKSTEGKTVFISGTYVIEEIP